MGYGVNTRYGVKQRDYVKNAEKSAVTANFPAVQERRKIGGNRRFCRKNARPQKKNVHGNSSE